MSAKDQTIHNTERMSDRSHSHWFRPDALYAPAQYQLLRWKKNFLKSPLYNWQSLHALKVKNCFVIWHFSVSTLSKQTQQYFKAHPNLKLVSSNNKQLVVGFSPNTSATRRHVPKSYFIDINASIPLLESKCGFLSANNIDQAFSLSSKEPARIEYN